MQSSFNGSSLLLTDEKPVSDSKFISSFISATYISLAMANKTIAATSGS